MRQMYDELYNEIDVENNLVQITFFPMGIDGTIDNVWYKFYNLWAYIKNICQDIYDTACVYSARKGYKKTS